MNVYIILLVLNKLHIYTVHTYVCIVRIHKFESNVYVNFYSIFAVLAFNSNASFVSEKIHLKVML